MGREEGSLSYCFEHNPEGEGVIKADSEFFTKTNEICLKENEIAIEFTKIRAKERVKNNSMD